MKENQNRDLERVLSKHLASVEAPQELWNRVRQPAPAPVHTHSMWTAWAAAAATIAISLGGWASWRLYRENPVSIETMAVSALDHKPADLELRTEDAATVRQWVKSNSGIDIPLPPRHSSWVKVIGASVSRYDNKVAEVSYQVGEYQAALLVTKDSTGAKTYPSHEIRPSDPYQTARVSSWSMRGQSYTLASAAPGEARVACLLCHGAEPLANQMPSI